MESASAWQSAPAGHPGGSQHAGANDGKTPAKGDDIMNFSIATKFRQEMLSLADLHYEAMEGMSDEEV